MNNTRVSPYLLARATVVLAFAGLSACNNASDPAANGAAADQNLTVPANEAATRDDDAMEADGRMHNEMSGRARGGMAGDDAMGGPGMAPRNGRADQMPPVKNDAMPAKNDAMPMGDDGMMMKDDM